MQNFAEIKVNIVAPNQFSMTTTSESDNNAGSPADETLRLNPLLEATVFPVPSVVEPNCIEAV